MLFTQVLAVVSDIQLSDSLYANWEQYTEVRKNWLGKGGSTLALTIAYQNYQACLDEVDKRQYYEHGADDGQLWANQAGMGEDL